MQRIQIRTPNLESRNKIYIVMKAENNKTEAKCLAVPKKGTEFGYLWKGTAPLTHFTKLYPSTLDLRQ